MSDEAVEHTEEPVEPQGSQLESLLAKVVEMQAQQGQVLAQLAEQRQAPAPAPTPAPEAKDPTLTRIDELLGQLDPDERYTPAMQVLGNSLRSLTESHQAKSKEQQAIAAALQRFGTGMFEERISQSIDQAMVEHKIPEELRAYFRPHLLQRMHETKTPTDPGQHLAPVAEALGTYNAKHAEAVLSDLRKPKPIAVGGVPVDSPEFPQPIAYDDRVKATQAILEQALEGGFIGSQEPS